MNDTVHRFRCNRCRSEKLLFDAHATWNVDKQDYELATVFPKPVFCEPCEDDVSYTEFVEMEKETNNDT